MAAQEPGEQNVLFASYGKEVKDTSRTTDLLPFFGTDYGLCSLVKPQISFNKSLEDLPFETLMTNYSRTITSGIQVMKIYIIPVVYCRDTELYPYI